MCSRPKYVTPHFLRALEPMCEREQRLQRSMGARNNAEYKRVLQRCSPIQLSHQEMILQGATNPNSGFGDRRRVFNAPAP